MSYPINGTAIEFHEERIQRLESEQLEVSNQVSKYGEQISYLSQQINCIPTRIEEKFSPILNQLTECTRKHDEHIQQLTETVKDLDKSSQSQKARWNWIKSVGSAIVMAAAGGLGVKLLEFLMK